ncbi:TPA: MATE family efflux transporter [Candidatus Woesearchaeota archaeon]|nr:MATE family efflux transporter [Candidatus Woesearchaeota archaeon]
MAKDRVEEFLKNPKRALLVLATPIIVSMIVQTLYSIVDTAFVGRLGTEALAALTFTFPPFLVLIALTSGLGAGMSSRISRSLGARHKTSAENAAMHGLFISLILAVIVLIIGLPILEPFFTLLGATEAIAKLATDYMKIILFGALFMFPAQAIASIFSAEGDTRTPTKVSVSSLVLNIILDPIFIYVLGLGVKGAAIATVISFLASLLLSVYFVIKKSYLHIHLSSFSFSPRITRDIIDVGAPAGLMILLMSLYTSFISRLMAHFGTVYVASYGIASRVEHIAVMPVVAFSIAAMILTAMFLGAREYNALKVVSDYSIRVMFVFTLLMAALFFLMPVLFLRIFTQELELLSLGAAYLRVSAFSLPPFAIGMMVSRIMQGLGYGLPGLVVTVARLIIIAMPLMYFAIFVLGYSYLAIPAAMVISGVVSAGIALVWLRAEFRESVASD